MKRIRLLSFLAAFVLLASLTACDSIVEDTTDPIDSAGSEALSSPDQVEFLINGIRARGNNVQENVTVQASLMSDQFIFGGANGGGATFPTFRDLMQAFPAATNPLNNNSVDGTQSHLGQYRFLADDLLRRVEELGADAFGGTDDPRWVNANFAGNFHGGLARYYWATYFGETQRSGGGVISDLESPADPERSEFIPSDEMYNLAIQKLDAALPFASEYQTKVINSVKARIALFRNNPGQAATLAESGLAPGDAAFQNQYLDRSGNQANNWHTEGGVGRAQTVPAPRFFYSPDYLNEDYEAAESGRIPLLDPDVVGYTIDSGNVETDDDGNLILANRDAEHPLRFPVNLSDGDAPVLPMQGRYPTRGANIDFITWQEMNLIQAEAIERGAASGDPLALVNEVRESHGISALESADYDGMNTIFTERDKEMFTTGIRLVDQRRATENGLNADGLDLDTHGWHLENADELLWWYLPITLAERNNNPNLPTELP
ncbi:RagB/SusD family nutrient uptake outer membrane protein [Longimonas halophila]|uniref:RagB/SusD family nutrient uptake outer membrane protein n=1 Tax=Longimonas halophila TaxID=1469170 RepID=UPI001143DF66|nr:RagB/SusD family nutrient uptake outer membrane protein [Longimonas halophila]